MDWSFRGGKTPSPPCQKLIYWALKPLENMLRARIVLPFPAPTYHLATVKTKGRRRIEAALKTEWGRLFQTY